MLHNGVKVCISPFPPFKPSVYGGNGIIHILTPLCNMLYGVKLTFCPVISTSNNQLRETLVPNTLIDHNYI